MKCDIHSCVTALDIPAPSCCCQDYITRHYTRESSDTERLTTSMSMSSGSGMGGMSGRGAGAPGWASGNGGPGWGSTSISAGSGGGGGKGALTMSCGMPPALLLRH